METNQQALAQHRKWAGKFEISPRAKVTTREELAVAYTPGVASPCIAIKDDPQAAYAYTRKGNLVGVITDGSAVLGLGNIGAQAGMPVMEGKSILFKEFAGIDAFPLCVDTQDVDEFVATVAHIAASFGGINLEDISAPRCFEIERRLKAQCDIPVFHDDQHGTAIVVCAAMVNAAKVVGKALDQMKIVLSGTGAAGVAIAKLLLDFGVKNLVMYNIDGVLYDGKEGLTGELAEMAQRTNPKREAGTLADVLKGADAFVGVSAPGIVSEQMVASMNRDAIVLALANPTPEIMPDLAKKAGAAVIGTGRSDFPNQINNVLAFPGVFKGALAVRARDITNEMKIAAANAIAALVSDSERCADYIIPDPFDKRVAEQVAAAVAQCARQTGVARI